MPAAAGLPDMQTTGCSTPAVASRCRTWGFSQAWMISPGRVRSAARCSSCTVKWVTSPRSARSRIMADQRSRPGGRSARVDVARARDLIGADADALPKEPTFGGRSSGRDVEGNRERSQHQGGTDADIEAVGITGDLAGEFGQADRRVRSRLGPGSRTWTAIERVVMASAVGSRDQQAAATAPFRPLRHPVLGHQVVLSEQEVEIAPRVAARPTRAASRSAGRF